MMFYAVQLRDTILARVYGLLSFAIWAKILVKI